jgi:hypothetical protein
MAPLVHLAAATSSVRHDASTPALDARFAIATLSIHCFLNPCSETQVVAPGQRIYSADGVTCTTTSGVTVVSESERFLYCRVEKPNMFAFNFDGAHFDCIGSRLGCHDVMIVDTTNGR